ncbi:DUF3433 domain-containing protein [Aspergillus chevalieri]|uniref:Uncharacterized protein n=1 Tax=Aspergillus chevalieri TaxID=182096 RepID=A0A7R7VHE0_ASPCH|nr:uncharacterized protein ACHE_20204A [Aspergillus chevalieri]BCR84746.1 hypothetical protein ACHE_20204A [Aspergillus chevalieri]
MPVKMRDSDPPAESTDLGDISQAYQNGTREIDYSGADYAHSEDEDNPLVQQEQRSPSSPPPAPVPRSRTRSVRFAAPEPTETPPDDSQNARPKKSLLQRLASVKRPKPDIRATIDPRRDRYSVLELDEVHDVPPEEMPGVDISFFEGFQGQYQNEALLKDENKGHAHKNSNESVTEPSGKLSLEIHPALRSKSIRQQGQDLANKTNAIVSVDQRTATVDLSVLEGLGTPSESDSPHLGKKTATNLSYFYPRDPEQPNWRPLSMRSAYIIILAVVSLVLAGVQEYLSQKSGILEKEGSGLIPYNNVAEIPVSQFFAWKYLPTLVTVAYGVLWQVTDYEVKRLEPYYQLSQPAGNTAEKSLALDYVTMWSYFVPFKAGKYRHWTVLVSAIGTILATTAVPSLQSPSIKPAGNPACGPGNDMPKPGDDKPCDADYKYFLRVEPVWSRLVTSCLILVAVLAIVLLVQLRRKSGLLSDPLGVAGVAAMANRSHILAEFQGMDESLHDDIHKQLQHRRYILYKSTIWQGEYTGTDQSTATERPLKPPNPQPIILRPVWLMAFIIFMIICLPFVPAITYDPRLNHVIRNIPWLPVLVATLIKQLWATLEFNVKMMEPFHTLTKGNARPEQTLTLDYQGTPYAVILFKSLRNRHWLVALVGLGSILSDLLTITFSSLAVKTETRHSFYSSSILSMAIVVFMIFSAILIFIRRRRPFMPRQPSTIASILAFIHQSRMLEDFTGTELYNNREMTEMLVSKGKRYGLGWFRGRDGRMHCAVDEEPMVSRFVWGVSYRRARAPWEEDV